jgi:hypothetical protein
VGGFADTDSSAFRTGGPNLAARAPASARRPIHTFATSTDPMTLGQLAPFGFALGVGGMFVFAPLLALNTFRVYRRLRTAHPKVWKELGSPSLTTNNSWRSNRAVRRWMRERRYEELADPVLTALIARERIISRVDAVFGVIAGVSFVLMIWFKG